MKAIELAAPPPADAIEGHCGVLIPNLDRFHFDRLIEVQ
jgi:hypothetical protein